MAKKKKEKEEYGPIYYQGSNPSNRILNWLEEMSYKGRVVYFQSGHPKPPPCPPSNPNCSA